MLLLFGAALNLWRLLRWRSGATAAEPLLLVLHVGYGWLVLGAALLGLAVIDADIPQSAAIHALTAGAIGTTTLAVMTRATRGYTGRVLSRGAAGKIGRTGRDLRRSHATLGRAWWCCVKKVR